MDTTFIQTGAMKEGVMTQRFTNIDANGGNDEPVVCLMGGIMGELVIVMSVLE
jgi:hypothetical protein